MRVRESESKRESESERERGGGRERESRRRTKPHSVHKSPSKRRLTRRGFEPVWTLSLAQVAFTAEPLRTALQKRRDHQGGFITGTRPAGFCKTRLISRLTSQEKHGLIIDLQTKKNSCCFFFRFTDQEKHGLFLDLQTRKNTVYF